MTFTRWWPAAAIAALGLTGLAACSVPPGNPAVAQAKEYPLGSEGGRGNFPPNTGSGMNMNWHGGGNVGGGNVGGGHGNGNGGSDSGMH